MFLNIYYALVTLSFIQHLLDIYYLFDAVIDPWDDCDQILALRALQKIERVKNISR